MNEAQLDVEVANAKLDVALAKAAYAEIMWNEARELLSQNGTSITDAALQERDYKVAQGELREAKANLEIAKLALTSA